MKQQGGFQKGNREATLRKRRAGGRPTKEAQAGKKLAADRAREKIEAEIDPIVEEYIRLAKAGRVKKGSSPQTTRHAIERWLPQAKATMDLNVNRGYDGLIQEIAAEEAAMKAGEKVDKST